MKFHRCAAPGCLTQVPLHMLCCGTHWLKLPPDLRNRINDAYKAKNQSKPNGAENLRREAREAMRILRGAS